MAKKKLSSALRYDVWFHYMGNVFEGSCMCCGQSKISVKNFQCGHVVSERQNGNSTLDNLRPICSCCNGSMGIQNMVDFMKDNGYIIPANWNGISTTKCIPFCIIS